MDKNIDELLADLSYVCDKETGDAFNKVKETINEVMNNDDRHNNFEKVLNKTHIAHQALNAHLQEVWS